MTFCNKIATLSKYCSITVPITRWWACTGIWIKFNLFSPDFATFVLRHVNLMLEVKWCAVMMKTSYKHCARLDLRNRVLISVVYAISPLSCQQRPPPALAKMYQPVPWTEKPPYLMVNSSLVCFESDDNRAYSTWPFTLVLGIFVVESSRGEGQ